MKLSYRTPEHDVDSDQRSQNQQRLVGERVLEGRRGALEIRLHAGREMQVFARTLSMAVMAVPSDAFGARLNETVTDGNCP